MVLGRENFEKIALPAENLGCEDGPVAYKVKSPHSWSSPLSLVVFNVVQPGISRVITRIERILRSARSPPALRVEGIQGFRT